MYTAFMSCTLFCTFCMNLSLRVHAFSSEDKLNLAINFSYSGVTETKRILLPSCITAIFFQFIQNSQASSNIKMCLAIVNNKAWVSCNEADFKINEAKWNGEEKNSPLSSFLNCNLTSLLGDIHLWRVRKIKWWNTKSLIAKYLNQWAQLVL